MDENSATIKRWYEEDPIVEKCVKSMETLPEVIKRQISSYLMEKIIEKPPFCDMLPDDVFKLATQEYRRRRWYDEDEILRIFVELLRHSPLETKRNLSQIAISFIEDLDKSVIQ
ncbi:MAG: hypothetical protein WCK67_04490 [bacterium]